ncbi:MAG: MoaD/ThiS family protein [Candidatus Caldarchaeum sp.]|nr:MoaD/ThiS family protein [Candidatus Caldarchaeum sp.]
MGTVFVKAFATVRDVLGGAGKVSVELREDADIKFLLEVLARRFGEKFIQEVLDEDGLPKKSIKIFVNGRDIDFLNGLSTVVKDGDEIALVPPVAGG